ncbi:arsenic transporter [Allopusillimonas soli]|uniref:Arsenical pump membrane protein n=1 Tax=Allopusillimonas soli TaxID=659016 RepID=A0A853FDJ1_9BURK|nr:arsenic transporter [Allopusillimonas soli]NYT37712.1 arsenic transporter [Allopusillimonas soli]TEA74341.1 arsenic transporter [Allopusillimonas soli]
MIAAAIFIVTLVLVIWQPRGLGVGWSASVGALLALVFGVVHIGDIATVWHIVWNATITFVAIIVISILLDEAGFFAWAALHVGRWGRGNGRRLFVAVILLGALVSAVFTNDGAALILTPIVMAMLNALRLRPSTILAFVMATGFIADAASLPLVVSNLVNIVTADYFSIGFTRYASVMIPVDLVSVGAALCVLYLFFRRDIPARYDVSLLRQPSRAIRDRATFLAGWWVLALLLAGFLGLERLGIPVSLVAVAGAAGLTVVARRGSAVDTRKVLRGAPWGIVVFSLGMYLVVYGLRNAGLAGYVAQWMNIMAGWGVWGAALGTGFLAAFLSSAMNNLPATLLGTLAIDASHAHGLIRETMVFANVIGNDLGPKITPIGSLATLLWLHVLQGKGVRISWAYYFRVGLILTLPVLLCALLALVLRLG